MNIQTYQFEAERTIYPDLTAIERLSLCALGITGEMAEVLTLTYQDESVEGVKEHLLQEVGDTCWYIAILCTTMDESPLGIVFTDQPPLLLYRSFLHCVFTEIGTIAECIKKYGYHRNGKRLQRATIIGALQQVVSVLAFICERRGISMEEAMQANSDKLRARHPDAFVPRYESDSGASR
jgi:NTP pyrophosphatase (non-canonical NTP hydrolase)